MVCRDTYCAMLGLTKMSRPKRLLEQIKGISEQKATKVLVEGT